MNDPVNWVQRPSGSGFPIKRGRQGLSQQIPLGLELQLENILTTWAYS